MVTTLCAYAPSGIGFAEVSIENGQRGDSNVIHGDISGKRVLHAQIQQLATWAGHVVLIFAQKLRMLLRRLRRNPAGAQVPHTADEHEKLMDYR